MKLIYRHILLTMAICAIVSCKEDLDVNFGLDMSDISAGPDGGTFKLNVTAGNNWVAATEAPWITISPANGSGTVNCTVTVDSTVLAKERTAQIYVQDQNSYERKAITVTQEGYTHSIISDKTTVSVPNYGEYGKRYFDLKVKTNTDFTISVTGENDDISWIYVPGDSESNPGLYHFNSERGMRPRNVPVRIEWVNNTDASNPEPRTVTLSFVPADDSGLASDIECETNEVKVTQAAAAQIEEGTRQGDSTALMAISRALNVWAPWDETTSMSTWSNVRLWEDGEDGCTPDNVGRVKYARFYMCGTEDVNSIPYEVRYLTAAEELVFYSNNNKERLNLSTGPYLAELKDNLKRLTIAYFGLSELDPSITELTNLEYLNLAGNNFQVIPEQVFTIAGFDNFHALLLNTNYRTLVYDLSNATNLNNLGGLYDVDETSMRRLLLCENLDTLTLAVNYLRGSLPTFQDEFGNVEEGVKTYGKYLSEHPERLDSLSNLADHDLPAILPNAKFISLNNNRFTGLIPQWLLYHPGLDWMNPFTLVFHQEGSLPREEDGVVVDAGFSNVPVDFDYDDIEGTLKNFGDGSNMGYYDMFPKKKLAPSNN